jgi:hypothetical protein
LALGYSSTALRFTAIRAGGFALALRGGASAMVGLYPGDAPVVLASAFGGALASAGTDDKRFTIGFAVPYSYDSDTDRWSQEVYEATIGGTL